MPHTDDRPAGRSQHLTQSRRQFLLSVFGCTIPAVAVKPRKPEPQIPSKFFSKFGKPEFWFGEFVNFCWVDENSGESHYETGEVVGVAWHFLRREWEYTITWVSSTAYPGSMYPLYDGDLVTADVLVRTRHHV